MDFDTLSDVSYEGVYAKKKNYNNSNNSSKRKYFPTIGQNGNVCNAATGLSYPYKIGSFDSLRLFKIVDSTGTCTPDGYQINNRQTGSNYNPPHLYYNNPEEYMRHWQTNLNSDFVRSWHTKLAERFSRNEAS